MGVVMLKQSEVIQRS